MRPSKHQKGLFSNCRKIAVEKFTQDMSRVRKTLQMVPPGDSTLPVPSCSTLLPSPTKYDRFSSMSNPGELAKKVAIRHLVRRREPDDLDAGQRTVRQRMVPEARQRDLAIPSATTPTVRGPAPYQQHLTPAPSHLRPHCLAKDRLRQWAPAPLVLGQAGTPGSSGVEQERVKDTMLHAWEEDTRVSYGAGLLMWHCFCDVKGVPESERAPTTQALLSTFVAHLASAYLGKTIAGYINGMRCYDKGLI